MTITTKLAALFIGAGLVAAPLAVSAQSFDNEIAARKGTMRIMALNLGILGGMARGNMAYDADLAQEAADNLVAVSMIRQGAQWAEGSDAGMTANTRAKAEIWADFADFNAKWGAFGEGAKAVQAVAGTGLEAVQGAMRGVGGSCQSCHEAYRVPE